MNHATGFNSEANFYADDLDEEELYFEDYLGMWRKTLSVSKSLSHGHEYFEQILFQHERNLKAQSGASTLQTNGEVDHPQQD